VFVASPSDVGEARIAVRNAVDDINAVLANAGGNLRFMARGWEQLGPGQGRPQEQINRLVDECDLFVGILGRKLGSPTGTHESGFVEEYERARKRFDASDLKHILLYFQDVPENVLSDPGAELQRLLEFKKGLRIGYEALYASFAEASDIQTQVFRKLATFTIAQYSTSALPAQGAVAASPTPHVSESEGSDGVGSQLVSILEDYRKHLSGVIKPAPPAQPDRLLSFALSVQDNEPLLPTSTANSIYIRRDNVDLTIPESELFLRSMVSNIGDVEFGHGDHPLIPGWYFVIGPDADDREGTANRLANYLSHNDQRFVAGAARVLTDARLRPSHLWPNKAEGHPSQALANLIKIKWIEILSKTTSEDSVCEYLWAVATPEDDKHLRMMEDNAEATLSPIFAGLRAAITGNGPEVGKLIDPAGLIMHQWRVPAILPYVSEIDSSALAMAVEWSASNELAVASARELLSREDGLTVIGKRIVSSKTNGFIDGVLDDIGGLSGETLNALFTQITANDDYKRAAGARIAEIRGKLTDLDELMAEHGTVLSASPQWDLVLWEALSWTGDRRLADPARRILGTNAQQFTLPLRGTWQDVSATIDLHISRARASAIRLLRNLDPSDRSAVDAELARDILTTSQSAGKADAFMLLLDNGATSDAQLLNEARRGIDEVAKSAEVLQRLIWVSGGVLAESMLESDNEDDALAAAIFCAQTDPATTEIGKLLYSKHSAVRAYGVERLVATATREKQIEVLDEYSKGGRFYWYSVIAGIDRAVFGPSALSTLSTRVSE